MRPVRKFRHFLKRMGNADQQRPWPARSWRERTVVVAAAAAEAPPGPIERNERRNHDGQSPTRDPRATRRVDAMATRPERDDAVVSGETH